MNKIIVLPPEISQKIAAGEVIERPFSVVKELVENALDAEAADIKVDLLGGGKKLIHVTDNGYGMNREDASVCFLRHSTSKIVKEEDLEQIKTLGFRGEALPSISAVSHVILKTSEEKEKRGTLVEREGEKVIQVSDVAFPRGTSVEVHDLFFNLPARKKFLRSEKSELSLIVKHLTGIALGYPHVRFSLSHGARTLFNYPPVSSLKERIYQIYGKSFLEKLIEVDYEEGGRRLKGYSSRLSAGRRDRRYQLFFVNKRLVRDKILQAALNQAYRPFLEKDYFAEAFLFLDIPASEVDVNVHPSKTEVRFKDSSPLFQLIHVAVENAVIKEAGVKEVFPMQREGESRYCVGETYQPPFIKEAQEKTVEKEGLFTFLEERKEREKETFPRVLGQYLDTYIIASNEEGILVIDQHNAHERILFEKYEEIDRKRKWPRRLPLLPLLLELSPSQVLSLESNQSLLEEAGFRVEGMGGQSFALKEHPDIFKEEEAKDIFLSLLEEIKGDKVEDKKKRVLAMLACKTAIKAHQPLSLEKMNYLVEELFKTRNFSLCPHGRPVIVKLGKSEIEKGLKRH